MPCYRRYISCQIAHHYRIRIKYTPSWQSLISSKIYYLEDIVVRNFEVRIRIFPNHLLLDKTSIIIIIKVTLYQFIIQPPLLFKIKTNPITKTTISINITTNIIYFFRDFFCNVAAFVSY